MGVCALIWFFFTHISLLSYVSSWDFIDLISVKTKKSSHFPFKLVSASCGCFTGEPWFYCEGQPDVFTLRCRCRLERGGGLTKSGFVCQPGLRGLWVSAGGSHSLNGALRTFCWVSRCPAVFVTAACCSFSWRCCSVSLISFIHFFCSPKSFSDPFGSSQSKVHLISL